VPKNQIPALPYTKNKLKNGLEVILLEDHRLPLVAVNVWYHVGPANERRQSIESAPYGLVQEELFHQLFPREHPYYASVIGSHQDIEAAQLADVREFFRLYYSPNNASLAIVGDIEPAKAMALVEQYFGPIPAGKPVPRATAVTPPIAPYKHFYAAW
jgi:predicted Zn-dependent peptidase